MIQKRLTILEEIAWRYAQLSMAEIVQKNKSDCISIQHYMIRAKIYKGIRTGTMKISSFFKDEKAKIGMMSCCYCGATGDLSMDHIIPRKKLGADLSENLLPACHHCNSSKGAKDMLLWFQSQGKFPSLFLLRRYLKLIYFYCKKNNLLQVSLVEAEKLSLPFDLHQVRTYLGYLHFPMELNLTESVSFDESKLNAKGK